MPYSDVKINGRSVEWVKLNGKTWWQKSAPPVVTYKYIDPIDPAAFPNYTGLKLITLDGSESWTATNGAVYTADFKPVLQSQTRGTLVGFCADYEFNPTTPGTASIQDGQFILNGSAGQPTNGNLSFKDARTTSVSVWTAYLAEHPVTILISVNNPDQSVWKPALRIADGATGYWNGASGFVAIYGGVPYYGDNLVTNEVINNPIAAAIGTTNKWNAAADGSTSILIETEIGKYYSLAWDNTSTDTVGAIFRWGFTDTPRPTSQVLSNCTRTTPQDTAAATTQADDIYMPIQVKGAVYPGNMAHFSVREMVYPQSAGDPVLFDSGYVDGIGWSANLLTRPNYTTYTNASLAAVETEGVMKLGITSGSNANLSYNCHVATTDKITIPATATKMLVRAKRTASTQAVLKFGLLGDGYTNSCASTGGIISSAIYTLAAETDHELALPAGFAGSSDYRAVLNIQDAGGTVRGINIFKVWFDSGPRL